MRASISTRFSLICSTVKHFDGAIRIIVLCRPTFKERCTYHIIGERRGGQCTRRRHDNPQAARRGKKNLPQSFYPIATSFPPDFLGISAQMIYLAVSYTVRSS